MIRRSPTILGVVAVVRALPGRTLALGLAMALAVPFIAPATDVGPWTALAASPRAALDKPAGHLRPDPGMAHQIKLREPTARELAAAHLRQGTGPCAGTYEAASDVAASVSGLLAHDRRCSHGPDAIIRAPVSSSAALRDGGGDYVAPPIPCFTSGPFVKVFYVYESGQPNRLSSLKPRILRTVAGADDSFNRSADTVGLAVRHVRWLMDANCDLSITAVAVPASDIETSDPFPILYDLVNGGKLASSQKALVFTDDPGTSCQGIAGIASIAGSDSPLASNEANNGEYIARVFGWCLNDPSVPITDLSDIAAHEVMHTMGAVQLSAPHTSHAYHCTDGDDIMCYDDGGGGGLNSVCSAEFPRAFDCNKDDYFNPSPPAGSYLASHWNTANNVFLSRAAATSTSTTAPIVAITVPGADTAATGDFVLSATATDPGGVAISSVDFYANGALVASDTTAPYSVPLVTAPTNDGTYPYPDGTLTIDAVAHDAAGRWNLAQGVVLTLANPRVSLTAPGDSAIVTGPVAWSALPTVAAGRTVARVDLLADGVVVATDTTAPYGGTWSPDFTYGSSRVALSAQVTDSGGSIGWSTSRWEFPTMASLNLFAHDATAGSPVLLLAVPTTPLVPIAEVDFYREPAGGGTRTLIGTDASAPYTAMWASPVAGDYDVIAAPVPVGGSASATTEATASLHVDPGQAGFGLAITAPVADSTVVGPSVALAATPTMPAGWTVNRVDFVVDSYWGDSAYASPWVGAWDPTSADSGPHLVSASAYFTNDSTFESASVSAPGIVINRAGPTVSVSSPTAGSSVSGTVTVSAAVTSASDDPVNSVDFYAGGRLIGQAWSAPFQVAWSTGDVVDGSIDLRAVAHGSATIGESAPVTVTVANGSIAITAPAASATIAGRATLRADATAPGGTAVERVTFFVDGVSVGTDDRAPFATAWNSATVTLGGHVVSAAASYSDGSSHTSAPRSITVVSAGGPAYPVAHVAGLSRWLATTSVALSWSATQGTAAIASYDVRYRRAAWNSAFGAYTTWLAATATTSGVFAGSAGATYCFSVRAHDAVSQVSAWTAETCTALPLDDRSLTRHGTWTAAASTAYYRSTYLRTSSHGAYLTRTGVVARRIALLLTTCPTCGTVKVYWGSTLLKTVSLSSSTTTYKKLISVALFSSVRTGTLKITVSSYSKRVLIDGVAISRVY